ncbi:MAG: SRPBCC family protein [Xanthomonadales bacterium]|nr:SRPBCC family protein [Xanthomonadales bacterium]
MSEYGELIDNTTVRFERMLPGPIERVWAYIVDGEKRRRWLCGGNIGPGESGHVDMHFHNETLSSAPDIEAPEKYRDMPKEMRFTGTVTRWEPPHAVSHTWEFNDEETSEVCYELEEVGDRVRLVLTHRRLETTDTVLSVSGGWHTHLDILADVLEGREPRAFWKAHTTNEAEYQKRLGA